ncbi:DASS family sodium-coupled anion symporter [Irregularibacter muris]|uniref:Sodium-dependent dicarboxylate transporter SdcS n=1 Tax=Irregularibacter muris TaxID=1796619 RepID=A0AAE3L334_9FIRM|nr:DASS family sodium-coupled anion symporter [Irregularibacter muris]MCR1899804.1 DASS family sodium-coupled anion symporter [Irregularibacter muris]
MSTESSTGANVVNLNQEKPQNMKNKKRIIWLLGVIVIYFIISNLPLLDGLTSEGLKSIALMVSAVILWVTEALPIAVASLVLVFIQHVIGISPMGVAVQNFANPTLLFVVSSFFLAGALGSSGLSNRISMKLTIMSKGDPKRVAFYLMGATATLSAVISDVPAVAAFFPIGLALLEKNNCKTGSSNFAKLLMIGIPFASLIGGVATPAGSSLNVMTLGLLESTANISISFGEWALVGIPVVIVGIPLTYKILTIVFKPELETLTDLDGIRSDYENLGAINVKEKKFIGILIVLLITWFTESIHGIPLPATATIGGALFFLPGIDLLTWDYIKNKIGWDTILLIGAATSLGTTLWQSGAATWIAESALSGIQGAPMLIVLLFIIVFTILIHLLVPVNPAIVSIMVPTLVAFSQSIGMNPAFLAIPMGFTVSAAFLLPLDPVPLITYASRQYKMGDYFKAGVPVCVLWTIIMTVAMFLLARPILF